MGGTQRGKKTLQVAPELSQLIKNFYLEAHELKKQGLPIAWAGAEFPSEMLYAFGVKPLYPENYATVCAAKGVAGSLCGIAESRGYSNNLCSYARASIGDLLNEDESIKLPLGGLVRPDFLVITTALCDTRVKWFEILARELDRPLFVMERPYTSNSVGEEPEEHLVDYFHGQLKQVVAFMEEQLGRKLDPDRLRHVVDLSFETYAVFQEVIGLRKAVPSPVGAADGFSVIFPRMYMAGSQEALDFTRKLRDEVKERVEKGIGAIPEEKYRVLWSGIPFWYNMGILNAFDSTGGTVVTETTYYAAPWQREPDPLRMIARRAMSSGVESNRYQVDLVLDFVKEFKIDGVVLSYTPCCRPLYIPQLEIKNALDEMGIPTLVLDSDMADERSYSPGQVKTRVEAFIEVMQGKIGA